MSSNHSREEERLSGDESMELASGSQSNHAAPTGDATLDYPQRPVRSEEWHAANHDAPPKDTPDRLHLFNRPNPMSPTRQSAILAAYNEHVSGTDNPTGSPMAHSLRSNLSPLEREAQERARLERELGRDLTAEERKMTFEHFTVNSGLLAALQVFVAGESDVPVEYANHLVKEIERLMAEFGNQMEEKTRECSKYKKDGDEWKGRAEEAEREVEGLNKKLEEAVKEKEKHDAEEDQQNVVAEKENVETIETATQTESAQESTLVLSPSESDQGTLLSSIYSTLNQNTGFLAPSRGHHRSSSAGSASMSKPQEFLRAERAISPASMAMRPNTDPDGKLYTENKRLKNQLEESQVKVDVMGTWLAAKDTELDELRKAMESAKNAFEDRDKSPRTKTRTVQRVAPEVKAPPSPILGAGVCFKSIESLVKGFQTTKEAADDDDGYFQDALAWIKQLGNAAATSLQDQINYRRLMELRALEIDIFTAMEAGKYNIMASKFESYNKRYEELRSGSINAMENPSREQLSVHHGVVESWVLLMHRGDIEGARASLGNGDAAKRFMSREFRLLSDRLGRAIEYYDKRQKKHQQQQSDDCSCEVFQRRCPYHAGGQGAAKCTFQHRIYIHDF